MPYQTSIPPHGHTLLDYQHRAATGHRAQASAVRDAIGRIMAIRRAGERGPNGMQGYTADDVRLAVEQAVTAEREACARIANAVLNHKGEFDAYRHGYRDAAMAIEKQILARSDTVRKDNEQVLPGTIVWHTSDCAVHNEPALPQGECTCGALEKAGYVRRPTYYPPTIAPLGHLQTEKVWSPGDSTGSGKWVVVDGIRYGIDECGLYRFHDDAKTYDRIEAEKFAAPVAKYIKDHGWDWRSTTVERCGQSVRYICGDDVLWFTTYAGVWSCPATDGKTGFEHLYLEQSV